MKIVKRNLFYNFLDSNEILNRQNNQVKEKVNQMEKLKYNLNESENLLDNLRSTHEKSINSLTTNLENLVGNQIELEKYI